MNNEIRVNYKIKQAADLESRGLLLHAVQIYVSLVNESPEEIEPYLKLADLYDRLKNNEASMKVLDNALQKFHSDDNLRISYGQFLIRYSLWEKAIEVLSLADPVTKPIVSFFIGYCYFMSKDYEYAQINFLNFISYGEGTELIQEAYIYLAKIEIQLQNFQAALKYAKKASALYSNYWELNLIYAKIYYKLGMLTHAVSAIEKAARLNPKESVIYEWAGNIYFKLEDYSKAEKQYLKFIESIEDASSETYAKLAETYLRLQRLEEAIAYFDIAVKLNPSNKLAMKGKETASQILKEKVSDA
jgi:tetratricopeptide (TPR) repeat protein